MTRSSWNLTTSRFALAAAVAAGLAVSPFAFDDDRLPNTAAAQTVDGSAAAADDETGGNDELGAANDESGAAEEFPSNPRERIGGTGSIGISSGEQRYADPASVNVSENAEFARYREAAESNDLDEAGLALSGAADRPVTADYVEAVNDQLGVQTSLTAEQIAEAANEEPLPY